MSLNDFVMIWNYKRYIIYRMISYMEYSDDYYDAPTYDTSWCEIPPMCVMILGVICIHIHRYRSSITWCEVWYSTRSVFIFSALELDPFLFSHIILFFPFYPTLLDTGGLTDTSFYRISKLFLLGCRRNKLSLLAICIMYGNKMCCGDWMGCTNLNSLFVVCISDEHVTMIFHWILIYIYVNFFCGLHS